LNGKEIRGKKIEINKHNKKGKAENAGALSVAS
jgi:hypothetical protein